MEFREVTRGNFRECIGLAVRDDQKFVASNLYSLAEAKADPDCIPRAIYADGTMVGFLMYEVHRERRELYLSRLMIDQRHQHRGYGRRALELLVRIALTEPGIETIGLSTRPDNSDGIRFYERFGFVDTGVLDAGEEVFVLRLSRESGGSSPRPRPADPA
jgi:diamine N-acetyltransferase